MSSWSSLTNDDVRFSGGEIACSDDQQYQQQQQRGARVDGEGGSWRQGVRMAGLHSGAVYCVEYTGKEGHLLSGGEDRSVRLTNGRTGLRVASYEGFHSNDVRAVCASAEGRLVASGGADRRVCVVDAATG